MSAQYLEVAFPIPLHKTFHYELPSAWNCSAERLVGCRVVASFGKYNKTGYVVGWTAETPSFATKPVYQLIDPTPLLTPDAIEFAKWLAHETMCSLGETLAAMLPGTLTAPKREAKQKAESRDQKTVTSTPKIVLNEDQARAFEPMRQAIESRQHKTFLLHGVTQSGKTELYFRVMEETLARGRSVVYLVPEISLTPLFLERLQSRFQCPITVWHSHLTKRERWENWQQVSQLESQIVVGTRSAVLTPLRNIGVFVLDEEHENTYHQEERPHYHAREVAIYRAGQEQAVVILGSATPSIESFWKAEQGMYHLLQLPQRVLEKDMPPVELIDMRTPSADVDPDAFESEKKRPRAKKSNRFSVFTEPLRLAIEQRLARKEQLMLFVNRRSFTPFLRCQKCGWVARCRSCSGTLALHLQKAPKQKVYPFPVPADGELRCHMCLASYPVPIQCTTCGHMRLHSFGVGTQRIEEELKSLFPFVKCARLDRDTMTDRKAYSRIFQEFSSGKLDALVGTQMIAKGFDFPLVSLVGIVDADVTLFMPDFRSAERTFQLITQMAGRTGRGALRSVVLVQTHHPEHVALQFARTHDYLGFYQKEIELRKMLNYPPFSRIFLMTLSGADEKRIFTEAEKLAERIQEKFTLLELLGPAAAPHAKVRNQFRVQLIAKIQPDSPIGLSDFLQTWKPDYGTIQTEVDPVNLS